MLYLFGDETHNLSDPYWGIGIIYTNNPNQHMQNIRDLRRKCNYLTSELKFQSTDYSQVLPAVRLIDYFFTTPNLFFKIIIKDQSCFDISYFENNRLNMNKWDLAYLTNYRLLCGSLKLNKHNSSKMILNYDRKSFVTSGLMRDFLKTHVSYLVDAISKDSQEKLPNGEFTDIALMIQLSDLFCGIITSLLYPDSESSNKYKKIYRKALLTHCPGLDINLKQQKHFVCPNWELEKLNVFYSTKPMSKKNA